ncbi:MAG: hypothetical protein HY918_05170 [Candidatus Doudnabacteria bacterium]|nr:hypothetical protein [Candidatus Doudnabacteria bacterium]
MSKTLIGLLFILAGFLYGSLAIDDIYNRTLGWLIEQKWIKPPIPGKKDLVNVLGRKPTILLYSLALIIIGLFIIWNRNN